MERARQRKLALRLGLVSAVVMAACTLVMVGDHVGVVARAAAEKNRVEDLEAQVKAEAAAAEALHGERERQTDASLRREARNRILAWLLVGFGGVFVGCGKWYLALRPQPAPTLDELVAVRFPPPAPRAKRAAPSAAAPPPEGDAIDLSFVDRLVERHGAGREAAIPILQAIQSHYRYLPDEALQRICERTEITPAQIAGTSSFYAQFRRSPVGRHVVRVCHGTACHVAGAEQITQELRRHLKIAPGEDTDPDRSFTLDRVACVGCCSLAPVMMIEEETAGRLTPASARQVLDALESDS